MEEGRKKTEDLIKALSGRTSLSAYLESNNDCINHLSLFELLFALMESMNVKKTEIIRKSGLGRIYAYEIFRGTKKPSRDTLLRILVAMRIPFSDIQQLLKTTGYPVLYPKNMRDAILIYAIQKKMDVDDLCILLNESGQEII